MARLGRSAAVIAFRFLLSVPLVGLWSWSAAAQDGSCSGCTCTGDRDGNGQVTVDEVIAAVNNVLDGCPQFRWYLGCPPRIPGNQICPPSTVFCTTETIGAQCGEAQSSCCPAGSHCAGSQCNATLVCTDHDPRNPPEPACRLISRRQFKRDIEYLSAADLEQLRAQLLAMNLTRFRYNGEPSSAAPHLGFIIEDVEPSPVVDSPHDAVDLYGYVSMAVAAIQMQGSEIKALRQEIDALRRRIGPSKDDPVIRNQ